MMTVGIENLPSSLYYIYIILISLYTCRSAGVGCRRWVRRDGEKNCPLKASVRRKEECLSCRVRFVPLTRRSLVQASNSRRARERIAFSFVRRSRASRLNFFGNFTNIILPLPSLTRARTRWAPQFFHEVSTSTVYRRPRGGGIYCNFGKLIRCCRGHCTYT